jgi:hypothetical protein
MTLPTITTTMEIISVLQFVLLYAQHPYALPQFVMHQSQQETKPSLY